MMIRTILQWVYYVLFAITPFVMMPRTSELFEFNKMIVIYLAALLVFCLWFAWQFAQRNLTVIFHWILIPIGLFLLSQILATIFSIDQWTSVFGYYGRFNGGLLSIIAYLILFGAYCTVADRSHVHRSLIISVIAAVGVVLWGIPGWFGADLSCYAFTGDLTNACWTAQFQPDVRMFSTLGQPNWLGAYLVLIIPFTWVLLTQVAAKKGLRQWQSVAYLGAIPILTAGVLMTRSRSAMIALAISAAVFVAYYAFVYREKLERQIKLPAAVFVSMLIPFFILGTGTAMIDRYLPISWFQESPASTELPESAGSEIDGSAGAEQSDQEQSNGRIVITDSWTIRTIVWQGAWELSQRFPVLGTGVETFAYSYYLTRPVEHNMTSEWDFLYNKAHNEFLNYLATTGWVGFGSYMVMIGAVIAVMHQAVFTKGIRKPERLLYAGLLASYLSILVTNFFGFSISVVQVFFYLLPAFALVYRWNDHPPTKDLSLPQSPAFSIVGQNAMIVVLLVGVGYIGLYYLADIDYAQAESLRRLGRYQAAYEQYQEAIELRDEHVYREQMSKVLAQLGFAVSYQDQPELAKDLFALADQELAQAISRSQLNVLYWKTASRNAYVQYQAFLEPERLEDALSYLEQAQVLSPTDPRIPHSQALFTSLIVEDLQQRSNDEPDRTADTEQLRSEAIALAQQSVALKPDYVDAVTLLAQLHLQAGNQDQAHQVIQEYRESFGTGIPEIEEVWNEVSD